MIDIWKAQAENKESTSDLYEDFEKFVLKMLSLLSFSKITEITKTNSIYFIMSYIRPQL